MCDETKRSIADSLETHTDLLPHMCYLLQDLWALGSSIDLILQSIEALRLPAHAKILDLGCGKGAVSVQLAAKFGFEVVGVDAMGDFLQDARSKAAEFQVATQCQFIQQDIREYTRQPHRFHVVILASVGGVFGPWERTISILRTQVITGGYILIDDGYIEDGNRLNRKGYDHYRDHETSVKALTSRGDTLVMERGTSEVSFEINNQYMEWIEQRAKELIQAHPELEKKINGYVRDQYEECAFLEREVAGALWVLTRAGR